MSGLHGKRLLPSCWLFIPLSPLLLPSVVSYQDRISIRLIHSITPFQTLTLSLRWKVGNL